MRVFSKFSPIGANSSEYSSGSPKRFLDGFFPSGRVLDISCNDVNDFRLVVWRFEKLSSIVFPIGSYSVWVTQAHEHFAISIFLGPFRRNMCGCKHFNTFKIF